MNRNCTGSSIFALLLVLTAAACSSSNSGLRPDLVFESDLDAAEADLDRRLTADPTDVENNVRMGSLMLSRKRYADARAYLRQARLSEPTHPDALQLLGRVATAEGKVDEAAEHLSLAWEAHPEAHGQLRPDYRRALRGALERAVEEDRVVEMEKYADRMLESGDLGGSARDLARGAFRRVADAHYESGYYRDAQEALDKAAGLGAGDELEFRRGTVLAQLGETEAAERAFEKYAARSEKGKSAESWVEIAEFYESAFQFEPAESAFVRASDAGAGPETTMRLGLLRLKMRNFGGAETAYAKALESWSGDRQEFMMEASRQFLRFQARDNAEQWLERAIADRPDSLTPVSALARMAYSGSDSNAAEKRYRAYLKANPTPEATIAVSNAAEELGLSALAIELRSELLRSSGERTHRFALARLYHSTGEPALRDQALSKAVAEATDQADAMFEAGQVAAELKQEELAVSYLSQARDAAPNQPKYAVEYAAFLADAGRDKESKAELERGAAAAPDRCEFDAVAVSRLESVLEAKALEPLLIRLSECSDTEASREAKYKVGALWLRAGAPKATRGAQLLREYASSAADPIEAWKQVADAAARAGDQKNLIVDALQRVAVAEPDLADSWFSLGEALLGAGRASKSIDPFLRYIERSESPAEATAEVAWLLMRSEAPTAAVQVVAGSGHDEFDDPELHRQLGALLSGDRATRDVVASVHHYERYLATARLDASQLTELADSLRNQELFPLATRVYRMARLAGEEDPELSLRLGFCYLALGQAGLAETAFGDAVERSTNPPDTHRKASKFWSTFHYPSRAAAHLKTALPLADRSDRLSILRDLVELIQSTGRLDELDLTVDQFISASGSRPRDIKNAAVTLDAAGFFARAADLWRAFLVERPGRSDELQALGTALLELRDLDGARSAFEEALGIRAWRATTAVGIGEAYERRGYFEEAQDIYNGAVERGREDDALFAKRGNVRFWLGDIDGGHADLVLALEAAADRLKVVANSEELYRRAARLDLLDDLAARALAAEPDRLELAVYRVRIAFLRGLDKEAETQALKLIQGDPAAALQLAPLFAAHDRGGKALEMYLDALDQSQIISASAEPSRVFQEFAEVLVRTGHGEDLRKSAERFLAGLGETDRTARMRTTNAAWIVLAEAEQYEDAADMLRSQLAAGRTAASRDAQTQDRFLIELELLASRPEAAVEEAQEYFAELAKLANRTANSGSTDLAKVEREFLSVVGQFVAAGDLERAEFLLDTALAIGPGMMLVRAGQCGLLLARGEDRKALKAAKFALQRRNVSADYGLRGLGRRFAIAGLGAEFEELLADALEESFDRTVATEALRLAIGANNADRVRELEDRIQRTSAPAFGEAPIRLARLNLDEGRPDVAVSIVKALASDPHHLQWPFALEQYWKGLYRLGRVDEIRAHAERLLDGAEDVAFMTSVIVPAAKSLELWELATELQLRNARAYPKVDSPYLASAGRALKAGNESAAWEFAQSYVQKSGNVSAAREALLAQFSNRFRYGLAERVAGELAEFDRGSAAVARRAGRLALEQGAWERAATSLDRFVELHSEKGLAHLEVALLWLEFRQLERARAHIAAADGAPEWRVAQARSRLSLLEGDAETAWEHTQEAVRAHPGEPEWMLVELAILGIESREIPSELVKRAADAALERAPDLPLARIARAVVLAEFGDSTGSRADIAAAVEAGYKPALARREVAAAALRGGDFDYAKAMLDDLVLKSLPGPRSTSHLFQAIEVIREHINSDGFDKTGPMAKPLRELGMAYLGRVLVLENSDSWHATLESDLRESTGDLAGAIGAYSRLMTHYPEDSSLRNNLAYLYARRGENLAEARALVQEAQRLEPYNNIFYLDTEGWVAFRQGAFDEARSLTEGSIHRFDLQRMNGDASGAAESFWHLGTILQAQGQMQAARAAWSRAARMDPGGLYGGKSERDLERTSKPSAP